MLSNYSCIWSWSFNKRAARVGVVLAGADKFFFRILRFCGQRNPRRQVLIK